MLGVVVVGAVAAAFAMAAGLNVFWFNTVGFHLANRADGIPTGTGPLQSVVWALNAVSRVKELMGTYSSVFPIEVLVIGFAIVLYGWWSERRAGVSVEKQKGQLMLAVALGTFILAVGPFLQDPGQADYSVISFPPAALVIASAFGKFTSGFRVGPVRQDKAKLGSWVLLLFLFVSSYHFLRYSVPRVNEVGVLRVNGVVKLPVNYVREVASVLRENRRADGLVLATFGYLAHEAGLPLVAGMEMGGFSRQELPGSQTERYKIVNIESVISMIATRRAEYVIVSRDGELMDFGGLCKWTPEATTLARQHLERFYHALAEFDDVGDQRDDIVVSYVSS